MARRNLIYTIAIDPPGESVMAGLAKILVASLLRTYFTGEIVIFHNSPRPIFEVERKDLIEIFISTPSLSGKEVAEHAWTWKYRAAGQIDGSAYEKVLYLDADCIAQRNIDHLISDDADILVQREKGQLISSPQFNCFLSNEECEGARNEGINSGTFAVRGAIFNSLMEQWQKIDEGPPMRERNCSDQASLNKLLMVSKLKIRPFERGEVQFPAYLDPAYQSYRNAALIHLVGLSAVEKLPFSFGRFMEVFYGGNGCPLLNFLEV